MERPLLLPLVSIITGLTVAGLFSWFPSSVLVFLCLALAFFSLFATSRAPLLICVSALLFLYGNLSLQPLLNPSFKANHVATLAASEPVIIEGIVDSRPQTVDQGRRLYLKTETAATDNGVTPVTGRLLVVIEEGRGDFLTGDRIRFSSRIRRPRNYGLPGEFDYVRYLAYRNVFATAFVKDARDVIVVKEGAAYRWQRKIDATAAAMGDFVAKNTPPAEGAILRALLLGDMGHVPKATRDAYSRTGINHILSISGFHMGIIAVFIFQLLLLTARQSEFLLLRVNMRRLLLFVTLPVLVFYLFLTGAAPATLRSVLMIATYIVALMLEREVDPLDSLILAAMVILTLNPPALFDISFQLSFLALWGILTLTPLLMTPFAHISQGASRKLLTFTMASASAVSVTLLPVAYYFHRTSLTGLLSNFIIVPLLGYGAVITGFCALPFIYLLPAAAKISLAAAALLVKLSNSVIVVLDKIPILPLINPSKLQLLFSYLFLSALSFLKPGRFRLAAGSSLAVFCLGAGLVTASGGNRDLRITFFSIGQGEASLIAFPDGKRMLVDGGGSVREGSNDVGERLLAPALWEMGIDRLDYVVLTHPHPDHLQGLLYVLDNFTVGEFWESGISVPSDDYRDLKRILATHRTPVRTVNSLTPPLEIGGCRLELLAPFVDPSTQTVHPSSDANDDSVVFRLSLGKFAALFTGDIGYPTEHRLVETPEKLRCTVLKVAHHGSRHSSSYPFLAASSPRIAVVSAGYDNSFHLPTTQTLDALNQAGARVFRTDLNGTIVVTSGKDGENVAISSFR